MKLYLMHKPVIVDVKDHVKELVQVAAKTIVKATVLVIVQVHVVRVAQMIAMDLVLVGVKIVLNGSLKKIMTPK